MRVLAICLAATLIAAANAASCKLLPHGELYRNATGCSAYDVCGSQFCKCAGTSGSAPEQCIKGLPSATTCSQLQTCVRTYTRCIDNVPETASGCASLASKLKVAKMAAATMYPNSTLQRSCRNRVCTIMNQTTRQCNFGADDSAVCIKPAPVTTTMAPTTTTQSPTTTAAPIRITFPIPPIDNAAYESDAVYRGMYDVTASNRLEVASPLPSSCSLPLRTPASAEQAFQHELTDHQSNVATVVDTFLRNHNIPGFDRARFIAYFTPAPTTTRAPQTSTAAPRTTLPQTTKVNMTTNMTVWTTTVAPRTTTPAPTYNKAVMDLELAMMKHVNVRDMWLRDAPTCFTVVSPPITTAAPVTQRVFSAKIKDPSTFNLEAFKRNLTAYFRQELNVQPTFTVVVDGGDVVITITSPGDTGALAAQALQNMPAAEQESLGVSGLAPKQEPKGDDKKKFPVWVIGVIVAVVVSVVVIAVVVSRRKRAQTPAQSHVSAFDSELTPPVGSYQASV